MQPYCENHAKHYIRMDIGWGCPDCDREIPSRDYLKEAYEIIEGRSLYIPQREHLVALNDEYLTAQGAMISEIREYLGEARKTLQDLRVQG